MNIACDKKKLIFIVTSKDDLTADYLIMRLQERDLPFFRFNTEDLPGKFEGATTFPDGTFVVENELSISVSSENIAGIWYRRPKMPNEFMDLMPEALPYIKEDSWHFVNGLLDLLDDSVSWVSRPEKIRKAENKLYQLQTAAALGLKTPKTFIGNSPRKLEDFLNSSQAGNTEFIAKSIRSGRFFLSDGVRIFYTTQFPENWEPSEIKACPVIIQERIFKKRDIRVTAINDKLFSVGINTERLPEDMQLDWRRDMNGIQYEPINLPDSISEKLLEMLKVMKLSFGAFDLIEDKKGEYVFLEINPNGQWAWIEERTGLPIRDALIETLLGGA